MYYFTKKDLPDSESDSYLSQNIWKKPLEITGITSETFLPHGMTLRMNSIFRKASGFIINGMKEYQSKIRDQNYLSISLLRNFLPSKERKKEDSH